MQRDSAKRKRKYAENKRKSEYYEKKDKIIKIRDLINQKRYSLAISSLNDYVFEYTLDFYAIHEYGKVYFRLHDYDLAKEYFELNIKNESPNMYFSLYELGKIFLFRHNYEEAIKCFNRIIESDHEEKGFALLELGKIYQMREDYYLAEEYYLRVINNKSINSLEAKEQLLELEISINDIELAEYYLSLIKGEVNNNIYNFYLSQIEIKKGNYEEGINLLNGMVDMNKNYMLKANLQLMKIEYENANYNKCLDIFKSLTNTHNYYIECLKLAINCCFKLNDTALARSYINELHMFGEDFTSMVNYYTGKVLVLEKKNEEAFNSFNKVNKKNMNIYLSSCVEKMELLIRFGKLEEAYQLFLSIKDLELFKKRYSQLSKLEFYFNNKLNLNLDIKPDTYLEFIMSYYSEQYVLRHINGHSSANHLKKVHSVFYENIDTLYIYNYVKDKIKDMEPIPNGFDDLYIIEYPNIGHIEGENLNHIKVITFINSKDIITMYPYKPDFKKKKVTEDVKPKVKVKKNSQIEKFNRRYAGVNR